MEVKVTELVDAVRKFKKVNLAGIWIFLLQITKNPNSALLLMSIITILGFMQYPMELIISI